jgi:hypothetical protein
MTKRGWLLFLALGAIWGTPYLLIRIAVESIDPLVAFTPRHYLREPGRGDHPASPSSSRRSPIQALDSLCHLA